VSASEYAGYHDPSTPRRSGVPADDEDDEGIWSSAKKLAQAAGEKLSAAENEVWRRINKG
jgi:hypothetical protein